MILSRFRVSLYRPVIAQVLVDIERVDLLGVEPGQERVDDQQGIEAVLVLGLLAVTVLRKRCSGPTFLLNL
jgi:hypothetical protein